MPKPTPVAFEIDWNACIKCGACVAVCPQKAGFISPFDTIAVNLPCDIACMFCEKICPVTAISSRKLSIGDNETMLRNEKGSGYEA